MGPKSEVGRRRLFIPEGMGVLKVITVILFKGGAGGASGKAKEKKSRETLIAQ